MLWNLIRWGPKPKVKAMYKTTVANMQKARGRDTSRKIVPYKPRTKAEKRKWWFSVIANDGLGFLGKYRAKVPGWLADEVKSFGVKKWLAYWDKKTGKPRHLSRPTQKQSATPGKPGRKPYSYTVSQLVGQVNARIKARMRKPNG